MSRCPFARWAPAGTPGGAITPRVVILHTEATAGKAAPHDGLEWHFWIGNAGRIDQLVDTQRRADANNHANSFAISIETEDDGSPDADRWTPEQVTSILRLIRWLHDEHGIPLVRCPGPYDAGVGFHTMFGAPSDWTPVVKTCPGAARIHQFETEILPALADGTTPHQEEDMPLSEAEWTRLGAMLTEVAGPRTKVTVADRSELWKDVKAIKAAVLKASDDVDEEAIAKLILEGLDPEAIAGAIIAAQPKDQAKQIADELAKRLAS